ADVEDVLEALREHGRAAADALKHHVPVPVSDDRSRLGQQGRVRAEGEIDLVYRNQLLIVGNDLRRARSIGQEVHNDRTTEDATVSVLVSGPGLVALLGGEPVRGEVT